MKKRMVKKVQKFLGKILCWLGTITSLILVFLAAILFFSIEWMFQTWSNLSMDELIYHLNTPLDGTNMDMIYDYLDICIAPTILILLALLMIYLGLRGKKRYYIVMAMAVVISIAVGLGSVKDASMKLDAAAFVKSKGEESTFVEDYYVSPADIRLTFPDQKRNLIYIFLESVETTYADLENGGAFEENLIPELTLLSQENESFSGDNKNILNGGYSLKGSTWTIGGMFAQTSGIPLNISIELNSMDTQETFFAGAITLGDILKQMEYEQTLMLGSDATFGGRRLYFTEHGGYDIVDYNYAVENGLVPKDYRVWWGIEDKKLFQFAKDRLLELASQNQPFNLTMLTVDTHFEDGWVCDMCSDTYNDNQYANVIACSSAQVAEFVRWIQRQDFYENTTIVICGDHPTMDSDFCANVDESYARRVYTTVINSAAEKKNNQYRIYTTFDLFPTTLAAMGVEIEGDRLGIGTNLFSDRPTISEEIGIEAQESELEKKSIFLEKLADLDEENEVLLKRMGKYPQAEVRVDEYNYQTAVLPVYVSDISNVESEITSLTAAVWTNEDQSDLQWIQMNADGDGTYYANVNVADFGYKQGEYIIHIYAVDNTGEQYVVGETTGMVR